MPASKAVKRKTSKTSSTSSSAPPSEPKNKKKRGVTQLTVPSAPTTKGRVVSCGMGDVGQLGLGEDVMETTRYKFVSALGEDIVDICAGGMHSVALDVKGKVWTFGCNDEGALGRATSSDLEEGTPTKVDLPKAAVRITAGDSHTAALLENGDVYAWGSFRDSHGSMGLVMSGRSGKKCTTPAKLDVGEPVADIASGGDHLVILTINCSVLTMGCGEQGQLGRLPQRSASRDARQGFNALLVPNKVSLKGGAKKVWAGYHATFVVNNDDKLYAFGLNNYGQLGISGEKRKNALYAPTVCDLAPANEWRSVACGQHHTLWLSDAGVCYAAGRCEYGRLGLGDREGDAETLIPIPKLEDKKCISIAAGTSSSYAVTSSGELYAWGMGSEGQLGNGASDDQKTPTLCTGNALNEHTALAVSAGGQHALGLLVRRPSTEVEESKMESEVGTAIIQLETNMSEISDKLNTHESDTETTTPLFTNANAESKPIEAEKTATPMEVS